MVVSTSLMPTTYHVTEWQGMPDALTRAHRVKEEEVDHA